MKELTKKNEKQRKENEEALNEQKEQYLLKQLMVLMERLI